MGVELVNRSFVRELFNVPESRAKTPMNLEQHKAAYQELVTTSPRDGSMRTIAEIVSGDEQYLLPHYIQAERDSRRLGLHRVEEAIDDLTKEELREFVVYLIAQSKLRQEEDEAKLNTLIGHTRKLSKDKEWLRSLAQLNRLRMLYADEKEKREGTWIGCWFCNNQPIPVFDQFMFKMWVIRKLKRWLGIQHK
jgi:hypothetical protein